MRLFQSRYYIEGSVLLQSEAGITKWDNYYNVGFNTNFENLNSISKIFQKTQIFSFDGPTYYFYLFKNHWQTFLWLGERPPSYFKITKMWFGSNIKYLLEALFADFCFREGISCLISLMCLAISFLKIILKIIWNVISAFFGPLIRKHVTYAMYTNAMATSWVLEKFRSV